MEKHCERNNGKGLLDKIIKLFLSGDSYAGKPEEGIDLNDLPEGNAKDVINKILAAKNEQLKKSLKHQE